MKALFAKVTNIKAFPSTGSVRVEIEAPVEQFPAIVALLHDQQVLVTQAPFLGVPYGVVDPQPDGRAPPAPKPKAPKSSTGPLCQWAVMRCKELLFQEWLEDSFHDEYQIYVTHAHVTGEQQAREVVLRLCGIASRKELDTDPRAAAIFNEKIRHPYAAEYGEKG